MTLQRIREICLSLPDATEQIQWGKDLVFKIRGKMFCVACTEAKAGAPDGMPGARTRTDSPPVKNATLPLTVM